jgi:hypothetical protein
MSPSGDALEQLELDRKNHKRHIERLGTILPVHSPPVFASRLQRPSNSWLLLRLLVAERLINIATQFRRVSDAEVLLRRVQVLMTEPRLDSPHRNVCRLPSTGACFS